MRAIAAHYLVFLPLPECRECMVSGSSAFSKTSWNIWKFMVHVLLKPGLENFEHYFTSVWDECNCVVAWAFFGIALLWDWNENWPISSPVATAEFSKFAGVLSAALSQHHLLWFTHCDSIFFFSSCEFYQESLWLCSCSTESILSSSCIKLAHFKLVFGKYS